MTAPARGPDRPRHDGSPPRPGAASDRRRRAGRRGRPGRRPARRRRRHSRCCPTSRQLIAAGIDIAMVAVPTIYHEEVALALAEAGRAHHGREAARRRRVASGTRVARPSTTRGLVERRRPHRAVQPRAAGAAPPASSDGDLGEIYQIATRRQGPFPVPHRRRRRRQGPRHARHRPHRVGRAEPLRGRLGAHRAPQRPRARGHGRGHRPARERHHRQPPRQLALPDEGAHARSSPARRAPSSPTPRPATSRSTRTAPIADDVGVGRGLPWRVRGRRHAVRARQARAARRRARDVPRRRARRGAPTSSRWPRGCAPSRSPRPCSSRSATGRTVRIDF